MRKLLLGLIGLLFAVPAVAADLPAGYTELEYIESTGTQYIDLDVSGNATFIGTAQSTTDSPTTSQVLVANSGADAGHWFGVQSPGAGSGYAKRWGLGATQTASSTIDGTTKVDFEITFTQSSQYGTVNDQVLNRESSTSAHTNWAFAGTNASRYGFIGKVWGLKVVQNDVLIRDFIPCKNASGVIGMYDLVSGQFFTNAGTGDFIASPEVGIRIATTAYNAARFSPVVTELNDTIATIRSVVTNTINQTKAIADLQATKQTRPDETCPAGKKCLLVEDDAGQPHWYEIIENAYGLPNGYTALEYLQSDGASYLIVPYHVNNKTVFYCRYNEIQNGPQTANAVFGVTTSPDVSKANNGILRLTGSTFDRMGWGNSVEGSIIDVNAPKEFNTWYEVLYDQNKLYQNDRLYATSATQTNVSWVAEYDLGVFARNSASVTMPAIAKISSVWAKENGEYKINLIPARRNSDNVIGMYDTVNDVFYTNQGTGTFVAGPAVQ